MPNKIYSAPETSVTFTDSGGDVVLTTNGITDANGRISAQYDRGTGSKPRLHTVKAVVQWNATVVVGAAVDVYIALADGTASTNIAGTVGSADAALSAIGKLRNLMLVGSVEADQTSATVDTVRFFQNVPIDARYYSIVLWNRSAVTLKAAANASFVVVTPQPDEIQ